MHVGGVDKNMIWLFISWAFDYSQDTFTLRQLLSFKYRTLHGVPFVHGWRENCLTKSRSTNSCIQSIRRPILKWRISWPRETCRMIQHTKHCQIQTHANMHALIALKHIDDIRLGGLLGPYVDLDPNIFTSSSSINTPYLCISRGSYEVVEESFHHPARVALSRVNTSCDHHGLTTLQQQQVNYNYNSRQYNMTAMNNMCMCTYIFTINHFAYSCCLLFGLFTNFPERGRDCKQIIVN